MNETLAILEKVNSFYFNAWSQLLSYTSALFCVIGILVPILIQIYQKERLKLEEEKVRQSLADEIKKVKENLKEVILSEMERKEKDLIEKITVSEGRSFHLQAASNFNERRYPVVLESAICAAECYLSGKDELNLGRVLNLIKQVLLKISSDEFFAPAERFEEKLKKLKGLLHDKNENGRYTDVIRDIGSGMTELEKKKGKDIKK